MKTVDKLVDIDLKMKQTDKQITSDIELMKKQLDEYNKIRLKLKFCVSEILKSNK